MIRFTKVRSRNAVKPTAKGAKKKTLDKLRGFLTAEEPKAVRWLVSTWNKQSNAITYRELREAVLAGDLTQAQIEAWREDYAKLVAEKLTPQWKHAALAAAQEVTAKYPHFLYEPSVDAAQIYIAKHGAELVTALTQGQRDAIRAVIAHANSHAGMTQAETAQVIRPLIGLTAPQATANMRHYNAVKTAHLEAHPTQPEKSERKAREAAARYADRQHRYRAQNIARTELASAYNAGGYGAAKDAQAHGYIGNLHKLWLTADDERVCEICGALDGAKRGMDEDFAVGKLFPPAHPSCRCAIAYEELTNGAEGGIMGLGSEDTSSDLWMRTPDIDIAVNEDRSAMDNDGASQEEQGIRTKYNSEMLHRLESPQIPSEFALEWFGDPYDVDVSKAPTEIEGRIALYANTNDWVDHSTEKSTAKINASRKRLLTAMNDLQSIMPITNTPLYRAEELNERHGDIKIGSILKRNIVQSWSKNKEFADSFLIGTLPDGFGMEGETIQSEWIVFKTNGNHRSINISGYSPFIAQDESLMSGTLEVVSIESYCDGRVRLIEVEVINQPKAGDKMEKSTKQVYSQRRGPTMRDKWTNPDFGSLEYYAQFDSDEDQQPAVAKTFNQVMKSKQ